MSTTLVPQVLGKSCWAASLEMFTEGQLQQCELLATDHSRRVPGQAPPFCNRNWQIANGGGYTGFTKTLVDMSALLNEDAGNPIPSLVVTGNEPSFAQLQSDIGNSAITLHSWRFEGDLHYIVLTKAIVQRLTTLDVIQWIKVFDPFPINRGRTYYLNYKEFSSSGWFKGIFFHRANPIGAVPVPAEFSDADPKNLVRRYIGSLRANIPSDFRPVTRITSAHQILDYEFTVTNTNVSILINNSDLFFDSLLVLARNMKMYLTQSENKYTSFFLNSGNNGYYISAVENGLRYVPVVGNNLANVMNLAAMSATVAARSHVAHQDEVHYEAEPDDIEKNFIRYFEKWPKEALICRFFDIGQEYVFFLQNGQVQVFDPFKSFAYILPKGQKRTSHLSLNEFFNALTQFYPILKSE